MTGSPCRSVAHQITQGLEVPPRIVAFSRFLVAKANLADELVEQGQNTGSIAHLKEVEFLALETERCMVLLSRNGDAEATVSCRILLSLRNL